MVEVAVNGSPVEALSFVCHRWLMLNKDEQIPFMNRWYISRDLLTNPLSSYSRRSQAQKRGREVVHRLKGVIRRQQFEVILQVCVCMWISTCCSPSILRSLTFTISDLPAATMSYLTCLPHASILRLVTFLSVERHFSIKAHNPNPNPNPNLNPNPIRRYHSFSIKLCF